MESAEQPGSSEACSLLGVPSFNTVGLDLDPDDDEGEAVIGIRANFSPLPRRKSSTSDEEYNLPLPPSGSRRVSFADAKGLSLVQVKEFDRWDEPQLPGYESSGSVSKDVEEYFLYPLTFSLPMSSEELFRKVQEQKVELEAIELVQGTTILKGVIRVLNISFHKVVYVRTTLDTWSSHFDLLAEYISSSSDSLTDCFLFKLTLVPPFETHSGRVEFCLRYETPVGTFWANNKNRNYVLYYQKNHEKANPKPTREIMNKRSCLKTVGQNMTTMENNSVMAISSQEHGSADVSKYEEKIEKKTKEISDGQSAASMEDGQKLLAENSRNFSRRNCSKAAHGVRKDFISQRERTGKDAEREESPPEEKQVVAEEAREERLTNVHTGKREGPLLESLDPILDHLYDASLQHNDTCNSESEACERIKSIHPSDEIVTDKQDNYFCPNNDTDLAENQNIIDSKAEENIQRQCQCKAAAADGSAKCKPGRVSSINTFGTAVTPLCHQPSVMVGGESQSAGVWQNPVQAADSNHSDPNTDRRDSSCNFSSYAIFTIQENATEKKQKCFQSILKPKEKTHNILEEEETLQYPATHSDQRSLNASEAPKAISEDTEVHLHHVKIKTDLQKSTDGSHLPEEAREDEQTPDPQIQNVAGAAEAEPTRLLVPQAALKEENKAINCNNHTYRDMFEDAFMKMTASGKTQNQETDAAGQKHDETFFVEKAWGRDTGVAAEEEEEYRLNDEAKSQIMSTQEKDQKEEVKGKEIHTASEDIDTTEAEKEILGTENMDEDVVKQMVGLGSIVEIRIGNFEEEIYKESKYIKTTKKEKTAGAKQEVSTEETQTEKKQEQEIELEKEIDFADMHEVSIERTDVQEEVLIVFNKDDEEDVERMDQMKPGEEDVEKENVNDNSQCAEDRLDILQGGKTDPLVYQTHLHKEDRNEDAAGRDEDESPLTEGGSHLSADEPESNRWSYESASESDSDGEVELYMHCLRVVHTRTQLSKQRNDDRSIGLSLGRNRLLSVPMPSISECLDEEQTLSSLQDNPEDPSHSQTSAAALSASPGQQSIKSNVPWWIETSSWSNILKTLLTVTLFVLFVGVAYRYDFLACFGLYLISVIWLCCQGERHSATSDNKID